MKKLLAALLLTLTLVAGVAQADIAIGKAAPDIAFRDIKGVNHKISDFKGKIVVLEWTNPGCPFVHKFYDGGAMPKFQQQALANKDVVWIAVNSSAKDHEGYLDTDTAAMKWTDDNKFAGSFYTRDPDGKIGHAYGAKNTPHMFVIAKDGTLAYDGAIDSKPSPDPADIATADNYVLDAVKDLESGKPVTTASTRPYGCGVKYAE